MLQLRQVKGVRDEDAGAASVHGPRIYVYLYMYKYTHF